MRKIGIIGCSDGLNTDKHEKHERLVAYLECQGCATVQANYIFEEDRSYPGNGRLRAQELMKLYKDPEITDIFDVSGGNQGNEVLEDLDWEVIRNSKIDFWGYSDLSTVINAIYTMTGKKSYLYSPKFLVGDQAELQQKRFENPELLTKLNVTCVQGTSCEGILVGGNIRCFLKLAGTRYFPDLTDKILLLEAWSGALPQMLTYLNQYRQLGAFSKVKGILLGTFTEMEAKGVQPGIVELVKDIAGPDIPIFVTREIGHGHDAKAAIIGENIRLQAKSI